MRAQIARKVANEHEQRAFTELGQGPRQSSQTPPLAHCSQVTSRRGLHSAAAATVAAIVRLRHHRSLRQSHDSARSARSEANGHRRATAANPQNAEASAPPTRTPVRVLAALASGLIVALGVIQVIGGTGAIELGLQIALLALFAIVAVWDLRAATIVVMLELVLGGASGRWTELPGGISGRIASDAILVARGSVLPPPRPPGAARADPRSLHAARCRARDRASGDLDGARPRAREHAARRLRGRKRDGVLRVRARLRGARPPRRPARRSGSGSSGPAH